MADPRFFKKPEPKTLEQIASHAGCELLDDSHKNVVINDVAPLNRAGEDELSFFDNKKYLEQFKGTKATACIVSADFVDQAPEDVICLVSKSTYKSYALTAQLFYPEPSWTRTYIADNATVHHSSKIGSRCIIDHGVYIGKNVEIGDNCWIKPNTVIGHGVTIGDNTVIGANSTLIYCHVGSGVRTLAGICVGQDGFGFAIDPAGHVPVPQLGRVIIGDRVYIGANTTIDRGAGPDTVIGDGCMLDNLVQIGHNVKLGRGCILVAQSGVAGSSELEDFAVVAAQSGVAGHIKIGMGARIAGKSGVMKDVAPGQQMMGIPAKPIKEFFREVVALKKLGEKSRKKS